MLKEMIAAEKASDASQAPLEKVGDCRAALASIRFPQAETPPLVRSEPASEQRRQNVRGESCIHC